MDVVGLILVLAKAIFVMLFLLQILPLLIWAERKGAAYIQDRPGPNRADIFGIRLAGLVHTLTDVVKLLFKEDVTPRNVYQPFYKLAPVIAMTVSLCTFIVVPFSDVVHVSFLDEPFVFQVANLNSGILYVLAISSLGVYGIMLAGWSSNNKYSLIGGVRSSAQMISYEIAMSLSVAVMFIFFGSAQLDKIASAQAGGIWNWGVFSVPGFVAFVLFATASFAETNRLPFDLPEGESELVAGYHTEYSAFKFAMFFMAEYVNMTVASGIMVSLFFGGYQVPFLTTKMLQVNAPLLSKVVFLGGAAVAAVAMVMALRAHKPGRYGDNRDHEPRVVAALAAGGVLVNVVLAILPYSNPDLAAIFAMVMQLSIFTAKVLFFCWVFIWVRWTLPRFRYDQLMRLGWNYMLPIGFFNVFLAGLWTIFFPKGLF